MLNLFSSEPMEAKLLVQLLNSYLEPAAIFSKNGDLKLANPEWRISQKDGQFEAIFKDKATKDKIFRIGKALRHRRPLTEAIEEYIVQITPFGDDNIVRLLSLGAPKNKNFDIEEENVVKTVPLPAKQIESIAEVPPISRANLASLIAGAPLGIARLSGRDISSAQIIGTNPAFVRISGVDSGQNLREIVSDEDVIKLDKLAIGSVSPVELVMKNNNKTICEAWLLEDGEKGAAVLLIDISERREMEGRLTQANKMEVIGKIASEVAHELNNLLTVIVLNTDALLMRHPVGDPSYQELQGIRNTTGRAANLVHTLLAFSRKQTFRREVLDIGAVLTEFSYLLHQVLDERVKFEIHHGRDLPNVMADKQQLETMFMNFITNARDAVLSHNPSGGWVKMSTKKASRDELVKALKDEKVADIPNVKYCQISVSDNGSGMTQETAKKIFEPFFTTKETGKGTGIGMASVYGIVKQSGGYITLETEVGKGTTFSVFLPEANEEEAVKAAPAPVKEPVKRATNLSGKGRILLVEDEDGLRSITAQILKQRGYDVKEAGDGEEALEILEQNSGEIDLLISDVVMPIMDGPTLLKEAKPYLGEARVIFMSGYAEQDFGEILEKDRDIHFLPKPFEMVQLAEKVKTVLGGG
ncbi:ATP-binding protein [Pseudaquidulcibacter saccharophilus]|uniref:ATP-binding protein n=1 Tax=Pseudaquidulcibacter saccharophilus TaxID=2831900 RepID=UPI001EFF513B|nr:ATP-binding protein [Pseudaquidulcibacter saccharophilus]